ncbi:hypothetical protein JAAARDRAFT_617681 [Jaapia argillacea MUCL 33604]|uniref:INO80 complex subunit B-like conserved region domain-containing protein n=1 Tax=Jaapia argillacea MUCL 33604 TaxID=933084 RepID=A0A067PF35_9AGAM|nr:hypothetical protein JAAARDRAFT_617681 [Jaapia argillacea MUCL 33604]
MDELSSPPEDDRVPVQPRLKIRLKLPAHTTSSTSSAGVATPEEPTRDIDIESEESDELNIDGSTRSASVSASTRPMTARQAAHAGVVETTHVSLTNEPSRKKKLTDTEIALRREETARKRKHLSEKKKEEEKAETINRLLRAKSSRSKSAKKRLITLGTSVAPTPTGGAGGAEEVPGTPNTPDVTMGEADGMELAEGEVGEEGGVVVVPTMYRWVSSTKVAEGGEKKVVLSFSVPVAALPDDEGERRSQPVKSRKAVCDVGGCGQPRKYRLVRDWERGACGMGHLKVLESAAG